MNKTELLNRLSPDGDTRLLLARALDKLETARQKNIPACTGFLSPAERAAVEGLIAACGHPAHLFYGGFEGAERTVCVFLPDWQEAEDWLAGELPLCALRAGFPAGSGLTHRDFLGALLGLGISREKLGDFLVFDDRCDLILLAELSDFLLQNFLSAGRVKVKLAPLPLSALTPPAQEVKTIRDTVATLRLDAVASSGFSLARAKAAALIESGKVQLNHKDCEKPDKLVCEGDVISCRGLGKCVVTQVLGQSKKGRIMLMIDRYV